MNWKSSAILFITFKAAQAFTFTNTAPTECGNLAINWDGGQGPFEILFAPVFGTPRNVTVPAGRTFTVPQLQYPRGQRFLITMSDATGFAAGGTSAILTVGAAAAGAARCDTKDPGVAFSFSLDSQLQQCRPYTFGSYTRAVQPVTIMGLIPGGKSFELNPPTGPTSFDWVANVPANTEVIFVMSDSQGRQGGASEVERVGASTDTTCLSTNPTPTKPNASGARPSGTKPTSSSSASASSAPTAGKKSGGLVGAVIGCIAGLGALGALVFFYLRRRKASPQDNGILPFKETSGFSKFKTEPLEPPYNQAVPNTATSASTAGFTAGLYTPQGQQAEFNPYAAQSNPFATPTTSSHNLPPPPDSATPAQQTYAAPATTEPPAQHSNAYGEVRTEPVEQQQPLGYGQSAPYQAEPAPQQSYGYGQSAPYQAESTPQQNYGYGQSSPYLSQQAEPAPQQSYGYGQSSPYPSQQAEPAPQQNYGYGQSSPYPSQQAEAASQQPYGSPYPSQQAEATSQQPYGYGQSSPYPSQQAEAAVQQPYGYGAAPASSPYPSQAPAYNQGATAATPQYTSAPNVIPLHDMRNAAPPPPPAPVQPLQIQRSHVRSPSPTGLAYLSD